MYSGWSASESQLLPPGSLDDFEQIFLPIVCDFFILPNNSASSRLSNRTLLCEQSNAIVDPLVDWEFYGMVDGKYQCILMANEPTLYTVSFRPQDWRSVVSQYKPDNYIHIQMYPIHKRIRIPQIQLAEVLDIRPDLRSKINYNRPLPSWPIRTRPTTGSSFSTDAGRSMSDISRFTPDERPASVLNAPESFVGGGPHPQSIRSGWESPMESPIDHFDYNAPSGPSPDFRRSIHYHETQDEMACKCNDCSIS